MRCSPYLLFFLVFLLPQIALAGPSHRGAMYFPDPADSGGQIRADLRKLRAMGANLVRWQLFVSDVHGYDHNGKQNSNYAVQNYSLNRLQAFLPFLESEGLEIVVDLHCLKICEEISENTFYDGSTDITPFINFWSDAAARFKGNDVIYGFDLFNEPKGTTANWRAAAVAMRNAIHDVDPNRLVIVQSLRAKAIRLSELQPLGTARGPVAYSFHAYQPLEYSHQGVTPRKGTYDSYRFPGPIGSDGSIWNMAKLLESLQRARDYQQQHNVDIFVGEFSAARWAPGAPNYLKSMIRIFERWGWDWAYHAWRESEVWDLEYVDDRETYAFSDTPTDRYRTVKTGLGFTTNPAPLARSYQGVRAFDSAHLWHPFFAPGGETPLVGDFNGDDFVDIATFTHGSRGDVIVALSNGVDFVDTRTWHDYFAPHNEVPLVGDFNADGLDDIATFTQGGSADVYVALSDGERFVGTGVRWHSNFSPAGETPAIGDVNGDGKDDIITFTQGSSADVYVALSSGSNFGNASRWHSNFAPGAERPAVADFDGDGKDDIITFVNNSGGNVYVALSNGTTFRSAKRWHGNFAPSGRTPRVGDVNGDGRADIISFLQGSSGRVNVALSSGSKFGARRKWHNFFAPDAEIPHVGDFNADGQDDIVTFVGGGRADVIVATSRY